jgi:hypothetical protein
MLTHYFSCSGETGTDSKKHARTHCVELMFLHPMGSAGHVVESGVRGVRRDRTIFHARVGPVRIRQKVHRETFG